MRERNTITLAGVITRRVLGKTVFTSSDRLYNVIVPECTSTDGNKQLREVIFKSSSWLATDDASLISSEAAPDD